MLQVNNKNYKRKTILQENDKTMMKHLLGQARHNSCRISAPYAVSFYINTENT